jgi:hypothetical protein
MWKVSPNDNTMQTSYQYLDSVDDMTKPVFSISVMGTVRGWGYGVQHHCQHYFSFIVAVSFNSGGNRNTRRKPPTCRKSLTNFITYCCIEHTLPELD